MKVWLCSNSYAGEFLIATTRSLLIDEIIDRNWINKDDDNFINTDSSCSAPTLYETFGEDWKNAIKNWTDNQIADNYDWDILIEEMNVIGT